MSKIPSFLQDLLDEEKKATLLSNLGDDCEDGAIHPQDPSLAFALGGGFAKDRINVLAGPSGTGKSFLALQTAASLQSKDPDKWVFIVDTEYNLQTKDQQARLVKMGLNPNRTFIYSSNEIDKVFGFITKIEKSLKEGKLNLAALVYDSLGGLADKTSEDKLSQGEVEGASHSFGGHAKILSAVLKVILRVAAEHNVTVMLIQHAMVQMDPNKAKGSPWIITGGQKLKFLSNVMVLLENIERKDAGIKGDGESVENGDKDFVRTGKLVRFSVIKSRFCPEGRKAEVAFNFADCSIVQKEKSLFNVACLTGVVYHPEGQGNSWWAFKNENGEEVKAYGQTKLMSLLSEPSNYKLIEEAVLGSKYDESSNNLPFELGE